MKSIFNTNELEYIKKSNNSSKTIAGLYASKEAFLKSLKMGINNYSLLDIEIIHDYNRCPSIILHGQIKKRRPEYGGGSRREGLPVNVIEAMAMGNPIIATDVRGNNDLVREGVNGYLVGLNDSEAMAEKINYLIEHPDAVETLGKASCKMSETYSMENAVREMEEIYRELKLL